MQPRQHHQSFRKNSSSKGFKMSRTWLRLFDIEQNDKLTGCFGNTLRYVTLVADQYRQLIRRWMAFVLSLYYSEELFIKYFYLI